MILSNSAKLNRIKAALGLSIGADSTITAQWLTSGDVVLVTWATNTITLDYNEGSDAATFTGTEVNPTTDGTPTKSRILLSGVPILESNLFSLSDGAAPVTTVATNNNCTFSHISIVDVLAGVTLSDDARKRAQKAVVGLGSSAVSGLTCRIWDGSTVLVNWTSFNTTDNADSVNLTTSDVAAVASGTPTQFQIVNGGSVDITFPMTNITISDGSNTVTNVVSGELYRCNAIQLSVA